MSSLEWINTDAKSRMWIMLVTRKAGEVQCILQAHTFLGTGLRFGELAGLRCRGVHVDRPVPVLQVVEVRYQADGEFGRGFKGRPKSDAGIRELPLAPLVIEAIRRQLPSDSSHLTATPISLSSPAQEAVVDGP